MKLFRSQILQSREDIRSSPILRLFHIILNIYSMSYSLQSILTCFLSYRPTPFLPEEHHYYSKFTLRGLSVREINSQPRRLPSSSGGKAYALFPQHQSLDSQSTSQRLWMPGNRGKRSKKFKKWRVKVTSTTNFTGFILLSWDQHATIAQNSRKVNSFQLLSWALQVAPVAFE